MKTIQHTALYYIALYSARNRRYADNRIDFQTEFRHELPFVLLADGIRGYCGARQMSHFEKTPDGTAVSFMKFPSEEVLKNLSKDTFKEQVQCQLVDGYYEKCDIGEETSIHEFDRHNFGHNHYHALRIHLFQDAILDEVLRKELINHSQRAKNQYTVRHNQSVKIDGKELRKQISEFENLGFIKLAGYVYETTGTLMNLKWFENVVYPALCQAYPKDLADSAFYFMKRDLEGKVDERITNYEFALTDEDKALVPMALDLDSILTDMYINAYYYTRREL